MDKNQKLNDKSNNDSTSDASKKPIVLDEVPEPRGKYGGQIDTDLDNYCQLKRQSFGVFLILLSK
ncbi:hypothetical protein [Neobacillus vireti]|uniref:hypothetical protein n=1 Tax=Neobacillus vireti TaxID=220686 RepID=UPI003000AB7C